MANSPVDPQFSSPETKLDLSNVFRQLLSSQAANTREQQNNSGITSLISLFANGNSQNNPMFQFNGASQVVASLLPLIGVIPLDQIPNADPQATMALVTSLPQLINLFQTFAQFKLPITVINIDFQFKER